ncbi:MAG: mandelate racemase/muconate lactonizing enzyme family protein [Chloroflexota bacterium]
MSNPAIDSITIQHYRIPLDPPFHASWDPNPRKSFTSTLVRVTAGGYEGVGSGDAMLGFEGHEHLFVGQDPFQIERHVKIIDNLQFHYGRMWPLEAALWDLMGKISGLPVWKLMGGKRTMIKPYASTGTRIPPEQRAEAIVAIRDLGYEAVKLRFHAADPRSDLAIVRAVRDAVGPDLKIMVDANQGWQMPWDDSDPWDFKTALWMADALAELDVFWLEEPLPRNDYRGMAELRRLAKIRIGGGEGNRSYAEHAECLYHRSLDVYQADVVWSTGLLRAKELAQEAARQGAFFSPHTWGDGLVFLANLHVTCAVSNAPYLEFPFDPPWWTPERRDFILPEPFYPNADGYLDPGEKPGFGIEIERQALEPLRIKDGDGTIESV